MAKILIRKKSNRVFFAEIDLILDKITRVVDVFRQLSASDYIQQFKISTLICQKKLYNPVNEYRILKDTGRNSGLSSIPKLD
jgi:hypothetical protein